MCITYIFPFQFDRNAINAVIIDDETVEQR